MIEIKKCLRCDHELLPRVVTKPQLCPKCKTRYWDTERKSKDDPDKRFRDGASTERETKN